VTIGIKWNGDDEVCNWVWNWRRCFVIEVARKPSMSFVDSVVRERGVCW